MQIQPTHSYSVIQALGHELGPKGGLGVADLRRFLRCRSVGGGANERRRAESMPSVRMRVNFRFVLLFLLFLPLPSTFAFATVAVAVVVGHFCEQPCEKNTQRNLLHQLQLDYRTQWLVSATATARTDRHSYVARIQLLAQSVP